jgi:uncharacterized protein DUF5522
MSRVSKRCWKCGSEFACGVSSSGCWCEGFAPLRPVEGEDCLCPDCLLTESKAQEHATTRPALAKGEDYYLEGAAVVFTAAYHLRRGYCCGNGCRHCPYGNNRVAKSAR